MSELNAITKRLEEIENRRQRYVDGLATQHGLPVVPAPSYLNDTQFLLEQLKEANKLLDAIRSFRSMQVLQFVPRELADAILAITPPEEAK